MRDFIKIIAGVLAVPAIIFVGGFSYGMYLGFQQVGQVEDTVADWEAEMLAMEDCGSGDKALYDSNPLCEVVCESYFQCRNEYQILEYMVEQEWATLADDTYTEAEYEKEFGSISK